MPNMDHIQWNDCSLQPRHTSSLRNPNLNSNDIEMIEENKSKLSHVDIRFYQSFESMFQRKQNIACSTIKATRV